MTVTQLLERLAGAFPAFNARAVEAWAPVFRAQFGKREGPHLADAFTACLASFDPKARNKLFPTPPDIEAQMPSLKHAEEGTPPIRDQLQRRTARAAVFLADWLTGQGAKIKAQRSPLLYAACFLEAMDQAKARALNERVSGIVLDQKTINLCFQRAISTERVKRFGRMPGDMHKHWLQLTEIATEWGLEITPEWWSADTAKSLAKREAA